MPTVAELSDPLANVMLSPASTQAPRCSTCWTFVDAGFDRCYVCAHQPNALAAVMPIAYSVGGEQYHRALRAYKDGHSEQVRRGLTAQLAAVLWRFLRRHEAHLAAAAGLDGFDVVTVVPSHSVERDDSRGQLRDLVGRLCGQTRERHQRLLRPTGAAGAERRVDPDRYHAVRPIDGARVLLVDDTWTTGSRAQSAALALGEAGAHDVALVVLGRHINRGFGDNDRRLRELPRPFDWSRCVFDAGA